MSRLIPFAVLFLSVAGGIGPVQADPDWSRVPARQLPLFYPGPTGLEWVMNSSDHSGARKLADRQQSCFDCHEGDADEIGNYIVGGRKVGRNNTVIEPPSADRRRGSFPVTMRAAHDGRRLYLQFEWESAAPAEPPTGKPAAAGSDQANEVKLSVMFDGGQVEGAALNGCWASCHMDLRSMPDAASVAKKHPKARSLGWQDGVTKYLGESRIAPPADARVRGAWNRLRGDREIAQALREGRFLDLMQYRSGPGQKPVDGYVLENRHMDGGRSLVSATGRHEGRKWTVTFVRELAARGKGDHALQPGRQYTFGVAIHENHGTAREHHVSLGYTLGLDDRGAWINVAGIGETPAVVQAGPGPSMH